MACWSFRNPSWQTSCPKPKQSCKPKISFANQSCRARIRSKPSAKLEDSRRSKRKLFANQIAMLADFWRKLRALQYLAIQTKRAARRKNFQTLSVRKRLQHVQLLERLAAQKFRPVQHLRTPDICGVQNAQPVLGSLSAEPVRD